MNKHFVVGAAGDIFDATGCQIGILSSAFSYDVKAGETGVIITLYEQSSFPEPIGMFHLDIKPRDGDLASLERFADVQLIAYDNQWVGAVFDGKAACFNPLPIKSITPYTHDGAEPGSQARYVEMADGSLLDLNASFVGRISYPLGSAFPSDRARLTVDDDRALLTDIRVVYTTRQAENVPLGTFTVFACRTIRAFLDATDTQHSFGGEETALASDGRAWVAIKLRGRWFATHPNP